MRFGGWHIRGAPQKRAQVSLKETLSYPPLGCLGSTPWLDLVLCCFGIFDPRVHVDLCSQLGGQLAP